MDREIPKSEIARRKRIMWIRGGIVAAVAVVAVGGMLLGLRKSVKASDLKFSEVERGSIETSVSASGKVAPAFEEIINSPIATRVVEVFCKSGDSVGEGTPLLRLDLRLGEGSGAVCAYPILQSAVRMINEMDSFKKVSVTKYF